MDWKKIEKYGIWGVRAVILGISLSFLISAVGYMQKYGEVDPDIILSYSSDPNNPETYIRGVPFSAVLNSMVWGGLLALIERFITLIGQVHIKEKTVSKENLRIRMLYE